jgi:hypothetical protein
LKSKIRLSTSLIAQASLLLIFAFSDCSKQQGSGGLARLKPCRLPGIDEKLLCGQLTVFENRLTRAGRTIELNVVVLPAFDQKTKAEPLFDLAGGPGAAATDGAMFTRMKAKKFVDAATWCWSIKGALGNRIRSRCRERKFPRIMSARCIRSIT